MSSVISVSVYSERDRGNGIVRRRYEVVLEDNNSGQLTLVTNPKDVPSTDDGTDQAAQLLQGLKDGELSSENKAPLWNNTQADYDRRSLGRAMLLNDVLDFHTYLPLWQAMELRSGANANQRAITLGVTRATYDLMADRFGDDQGAAFFLDNAKGQIWNTLPAEYD